MNSRSRVIQGTAVLTLGRVAAYGIAFIRNLIVARLLSKADYGLAAAFATTVSLLELAGRVSLGQQIIQSKDGNLEGFQDTAHSLQLAAGLISSVLVAGLSIPMARGFGVPNAVLAFASLALVPFFGALNHLDNSRQQRSMNYVPSVLCDLVPQAIIALLAWPAAYYIGNYWAIVILMAGKAFFTLIVTHLLAERRFRFAWHPIHGKNILVFGWPLLVTGVLMFGSQQADQLLVGGFFRLTDLANYALSFSLASISWYVFGSVSSSVFLPLMSAAQDDPTRFRRQYRICIVFASLASVALYVPLIVAGEQMIVFLYGYRYAGNGLLVGLFCVAFGFRFLRAASAIAALAAADPLNELYSNIARAIGLPLALLVACLGAGVAAVSTCSIIGEFAALVCSILLLKKRRSIPFGDSRAACIFAMVFLFSSLAIGYIVSDSLLYSIAAVLALLLLAAAVTPTVFPELVEPIRQIIMARLASRSKASVLV